MKKALLLLVASAVGFGLIAAHLARAADEGKVYPLRWVYVSTGLETDQELDRVEGITQAASEHGVNGMLLSAGFDALDLKDANYLRRLQHLKQTCDTRGIEIVPMGFSVGYGGGVLSHDKNLAAALPVKGALFVAGEREARFLADPPVRVENGDFEKQLQGFTVRNGRISVDEAQHHSGKASLRIDNIPSGDDEAAVSQPLSVHPYRSYRFHFWVKTEGLAPGTLLEGHAVAPDGRDLAYLERRLPPTSDWQEYFGAFNSWYADRVNLSVGAGSGKTGTVWLDDLQVEEVGLMNVVRRQGTPVEVRNDKTGTVYKEGRDYAPIADPHLDFKWNHVGPAIALLPGSRIRRGDRLRVDYFHGTTIYTDQVPVDISEEKVYQIWQRQVPLVEKYLAPKKYFLSMDEVRVGGFCNACTRRKMGMSEMLGDCLTRQCRMIRAANPATEIFVWSDMFDPNHNAREKYYLINGSFAETWKFMPKDLVIACWYFEKRDLSLAFFSKLGYKTLAGAYYDGDDLENIKGWLASLDQTPGAIGIMYTTWENKYKLLPDFGDLVSKR